MVYQMPSALVHYLLKLKIGQSTRLFVGDGRNILPIEKLISYRITSRGNGVAISDENGKLLAYPFIVVM